ncbi:MAG TPA: EipA family protein [Allosphingosinicella sp.]|nr:EipA family protein [Allosphingosinicella sp.]
MLRLSRLTIAAAAALAAFAGPAAAQEFPPSDAAAQEAPVDAAPTANEWFPPDQQQAAAAAEAPVTTTDATAPGTTTTAAAPGQTIPRRDIFDAAGDLFGDGAEGLAGILERILGDQGEPIAYISGQEAGGAFVFGLRYGSGVMRHRIEGDRNVYWTGPSLGFDVGADANKVFVLVYNLNDSQRLFRRYPNAEGHAYVIGGFTAGYLRRGDVVLIPVRLGVGMRLGVNAGYMRFSERNRWLPF